MKTRLLIILCFGFFSSNAQTTHQIYWKIGVNGAAASKTIEVGDTVEWIWDDTLPHTVTGIPGSSVEPDFDSGSKSGMGMVYPKTFTIEGVNDYECSFHPFSMFGTITVQNSLSLEDESISSFKLYPNPSNSTLNLKFPYNITNANISVFDILGKEFISKRYETTNSVEFDTSNWINGIYLIKVKSETISQTKQFIKN